MSELCGVKCVGSGGWRDMAELQCWYQGKVLGLHGKDDFRTPPAMSVHVFFKSDWGDRKDSPIRSFQAGIIQWWSKNLTLVSVCSHSSFKLWPLVSK